MGVRLSAIPLVLISILGPLRAGVVIHYALDETTGQTANDSATALGGVQNGTTTNTAPGWRPGQGVIGGAIEFTPTDGTGVSQMFVTALSGAPASPFSMSAWIKTTTVVGGHKCVVFFGDSTKSDQYYTLNVNSALHIQANTRNVTLNSAESATAINDGAWHHIVGVYVSTNCRELYLDGQLVGSNYTGVALVANRNRLGFGALTRSNPVDPYPGWIDDVGLWDEALSPERIALLNALGRYEGVNLASGAIDAVLGVYHARSGFARVGRRTYAYVTGLAGPQGTVDTFASGDVSVVLGPNGEGVIGFLAGVYLSTPTNAAVAISGTPVHMRAETSSLTGTVAKVDFYGLGTHFATDTTAPYEAQFTNSVVGTNAFFAVVTDTLGLSWTSSVVNVTVQLLGVSLTSPGSGATFVNNDPITVSAQASALGAVITNVTFYVNNQPFGRATASPFKAVWTNAFAGVYGLTATALDNFGNSYTSAPVTIHVACVLMPSNSVWKYLDDGSNQGTTWRAPTFNDNAWAGGPSQLGYGDGDETTVVSFGPNPNNRYITTYFRRAFTLTGVASYTNLVLRVLRDDGAVVYLNGTEAARYNMPSGTITNTTVASSAAGDDGTIFFPTNVPAGLLVESTNVLAVEVHQNSVTSSDLSFDLELLGVPIVPLNQPPLVSLTNPTNHASFLAPATLTLAASASDPNGSVARVEFFAGPAKIGQSTNSPYSEVWTNPPIGWHILTSIATDDEGVSQSSAPIVITIYDAPGSPLVQITSPANDTCFLAPANFAINAMATDDIRISQVEFFQGSTKLGETASPPYSFPWNGVQAGDYQLRVVATDLGGMATTSAVVNVTVEVDQPPLVSLTSPSNNACFTAPASIAINAAATDDVGISQVQFFHGSTKLGERAIAPYISLWSGVQAGNYDLRAVATDLKGVATTSAVVTLTIAVDQPPLVSLTSPSNNACFTAPANIALNATATDSDGVVTNVAFYDGTTLLGQASRSPYSCTWTNVNPGGYALTAVVTDNGGLCTTSAPVNIQVIGSDWTAFNDHNRGAGTAPTVSTYSPSAAGVAVGGPLTNSVTGQFTTPNRVGVAINFAGTVYNWNNSSMAPNTGTPADKIFGGRVDWTYSGITFGQSPYTGVISITFTNLAPGRMYRFRGTGIRGGNWPGRWTLATLAGASSARPAHITGTGSPGIVTNGWTPFGNALAPLTQAAWNCGENRVGDVIGWDDIVPAGTSFSVLCSNYQAVLGSGAAVPGGVIEGSYAYAFSAFRLEQFSVPSPMVQIPSPTNGQSFTAPADLLINASVTGSPGPTNVEFYADGFVLGSDASSPYGIVWSNAPVGSIALTAVAFDVGGGRSTSAVVSVTVSAASINLEPVIAIQNPLPGPLGSTPTSLRLQFSEPVTGVDAADLFVNGVPATGLSGAGSIYTFIFPAPVGHVVTISWAADHGIADLDTPALAFDAGIPGATWSYTVIDITPPTVVSRTPPASATVSNLFQIDVTFSEPVSGVDAADFLVNGVPAYGLSGGGSNYTFTFEQPASGAVNISWATNHGIADLAVTPNAFNATGAGAAWSYMLQLPRLMLVATNSLWRYFKGLSEASSPTTAWRELEFDDRAWPDAPAAFYYGPDPYVGTSLNDMSNRYTCVFIRQVFNVESPASLANLVLRVQADDGCVAWLNGVEVARVRMGAGEISYTGTASGNAPEDANDIAIWTNLALAVPSSLLRSGSNVLAIQAFNSSVASSSDFGIDAELVAEVPDPNALPPRLLGVIPPAGDIHALSNLTVTFSKPVANVDAADLQVNGVPADAVTLDPNGVTYVFSFPQPAYGPVVLTWAAGHGITDTNVLPRPFDASRPGATWQYSLVNPSAPLVVAQIPLAGATVSALTQLQITFSEPVTGVDAADLLLNGVSATELSGADANYIFTFAQPPYGNLTAGWAAGHGIEDLEMPPNALDAARPVNTWSYLLVDWIPPTIVEQVPPTGAVVTNLTQIVVFFSEAVNGVDASDLWINGVPASAVSGGPSTYTFTFAQPNAVVIQVAWVPSHGIADTASPANPFNAGVPGSAWSYLTVDNVAPTVARRHPPEGATLRSLSRIAVTFSEPVAGVTAGDLLIDGVPALKVEGIGSGPYTFTVAGLATGQVQVAWAGNHGIVDLAVPPNSFEGGGWTYTLDPNALAAGSVVINEIMYNPLSKGANDEWLELYNTTDAAINLTGWRLSRGVDFTFPATTLPANGYLVVAADLAAFQVLYPGVTNVVGAWTGRLKNSDEVIQLEAVDGSVINQVHYASEGDWATRMSGAGEYRLLSLYRVGNTAYATTLGHYQSGDQVTISGADQPDYNGTFTISASGALGCTTNFTYPVSASAPTPATGLIVCRQLTDVGGRGWSWATRANGLGSSVELVNSTLPNQYGLNWKASVTLHGTPGRGNSVAATNAAPPIVDVGHFPAVPKPADKVYVTARIIDEQPQVNVILRYRDHTTTSPASFATVSMADDGAHGDGLAGDGIYGGLIPAYPNGTIIEFCLLVQDALGLVRNWPAPAVQPDGSLAQNANAVYQVDDNLAPASASTAQQPFYRLIMTATERSYFSSISYNSDAEMNGTFITTDAAGAEVRYNVGVRIRGAGSRSRTYKNLRVNIPTDRRWNGLAEMNFNTQFIHAQLAGSALAGRAALPAAEARAVQLRLNGLNHVPSGTPASGTSQGAGWGTVLYVEPMNADWAERIFPNDRDGNVYRASKNPWTANLDYMGTDPLTYCYAGYSKTSNQAENDWSDLMRLSYALNQVGPDANYLAALSTNVNAGLWMRYFALCTLINYNESSMCNGIGDDYAMYRGTLDRRFILLAHDFDTVLGEGDGDRDPLVSRTLWRSVDEPRSWTTDRHANYLPRFLRHSALAPIYLGEVKRLCDTVLAPEQFNPLLDQLQGGWVAEATLNSMKTFVAGRRAYAYSVLPLAFGAGTALSLSNGYPYATTASVTVTGMVNAIDTRALRINGVDVRDGDWSVWEGRFTHNVGLQPGLNSLLVQCLDSNNTVIAATNLLVWCGGSAGTIVGGTLSGDTVWAAANGPYSVDSSLIVPAGVTLTIQPGATVYLGAGVNLTVNNGGRLLAEGTPTAPIRFTRAPGTTTTWGGITINGGVGSPETIITYAHLEFNEATAIHSAGGTLFLDHLTFGTTDRQYLSVDGSSFVVSDCVFPTATAAFELVHGSGGIKSGGRGIFLRNFFGAARGYNDVVDYTGGQRPGPAVEFINNVFIGSGDDLLDLDGTDAWIEGNIFLGAHQNGSPDSASAISGGRSGAATSRITIVGNLIYDCDHALLAKEGNFYVFLHNTVVRQTRSGGTDPAAAVMILADAGPSEGAGVYAEGNIIYDAEKLLRGHTNALITFTNNLMPFAWPGPGGGNVNVDPQFNYVPQRSETTNFTSWAQAQAMRDWFSLKPHSLARGAGANGGDLGGVIPLGVCLAGEPVGRTGLTNVTLTVGLNRTGNGIPVSGWPEGAGYTHYKWRLDGAPWSVESPIGTPLLIAGLEPGAHRVEVTGKRDSGLYQDDTVYGVDAVLTTAHTFTVVPGIMNLRLNEILASNSGTLLHEGTTPDAIELLNTGDRLLDLYGLTLTDDPGSPAKFKFPYGATLGAGAYLVLYANDSGETSGLHTGFNLAREGGGLYLFDGNGLLVDAVTYGPQLTDLSVGRLHDGTWALTVPTFGAVNRAAEVGEPHALRLNEWLAAGEGIFAEDFIELYNPTPLPVDLGGLYLTDNPVGWPDRHPIAPLSFLPAYSYQVFYADSQPERGADHLNFRLAAEQGMLGLFDQALESIDILWYGGQQAGIAEGRAPNGSTVVAPLSTPTPGAANPLTVVVAGPGVVLNEIMANNISYTNVDGSITDWVELYNATNVTVDLGDLSLSDNRLDPRRWVFPAGITLAPGAYLRVIFNPDTSASTNAGLLLNTGFGLKASGDSVYLFDKTVNSNLPLAWLTFGVQPADFSLGRIPNGTGSWTLTIPTPDSANIAAALGNPVSLKVNEWLAGSSNGADWFEIWNSGAQPVALGGLYLTDDLNDRTKHEIQALSFIGASINGYMKFVADGDTSAGADHVGFALKITGEALGIYTAGGVMIDGISFTNEQPDVSEGRFPDGAPDIVRFPDTASPGDPNYRLLTDVVVNEVLSHSEPPLFEDAIELYNTTATPVDISGWYLSDARDMLQKFRIPDGTVIPAHGFVVFYEYQFNPDSEDATSFALDGQGDQVYLSVANSNGLTGYHNSVRFGPAESGVSFGRYLTTDGREEFVAQRARTLGMDEPGLVEQFRTGTGAPNTYPKVGPIVLSEIMYRPPDVGTNDNVLHEFIELHNASAAPVALFDPACPTNTWRLRNAVDFEFPTNTILPPDGYLLLVSFDPATDPAALGNFCAHYGLDIDAPICGPWRGKLDNSDERIELERPDTTATNLVPFVLVEAVHYYDWAPWPARADGTGLSLQRLGDDEFGNDPINWAASAPTPGSPTSATADSDGDGLPDAWEIANGLDRFNPADANDDADNDGLSNLKEFLSGTNPRDLASVLRLEIAPLNQTNASLAFPAAPHRAYTIEYKERIDTNTWQVLSNLEAAPTNRQLSLPAPLSAPQRFYRLRTQ